MIRTQILRTAAGKALNVTINSAPSATGALIKFLFKISYNNNK